MAGDFLWPKRPGTIVPYTSRPGEATEADRNRWVNDRIRELRRLSSVSSPTESEKERFRILSALSYEEFMRLYLDDEDPKSPSPFGSIAPFSVGHVAIVESRGGEPWIIEAMPDSGVRTLSYANWLKSRSGELVWHARLQEIQSERRESIVSFAKQNVGKAYDFWNFDLLDDAGFYCSKLAWYAVWRATSVALDDRPDPKRALWYSPKQMLRSKRLALLSSPRSYALGRP